MSIFSSLQEAVKLNDVAGFLKAYILLIKNNVSLSFPSSLDKESVQVEWQELVPKEFDQISEPFFADLADLWLRLIHSVPEGLTEPPLDQLLITLETLSTKLYSAPKLVEQGNIFSDISQRYLTSQSLFQINDIDQLTQQLTQALKVSKPSIFLLYYICLARLDKSYELPHELDRSSIESKWRHILEIKFKQRSSSFLQDLCQLYYNMVHTVGLLNSDVTINACVEKLVRNNKNIG